MGVSSYLAIEPDVSPDNRIVGIIQLWPLFARFVRNQKLVKCSLDWQGKTAGAKDAPSTSLTFQLLGQYVQILFDINHYTWDPNRPSSWSG